MKNGKEANCHACPTPAYPLMMLLLLPQAQAERLTLYTRPGQVDEATPFQLRPTELSICSVTRAMGGVVVLANDDN